MTCKCDHHIHDHKWGETPAPCSECKCKNYEEYDCECPNCGYDGCYASDKNKTPREPPYWWHCPICDHEWTVE